jgi:hypothetical protein
MMARIVRLALLALIAIASVVFLYGMSHEFRRLPPPSAPPVSQRGDGNEFPLEAGPCELMVERA